MKRRDQSGFALLLVFVMAAVIAIGLYFEMPRVAFESQRSREQMAIDRANQYKRAIQLFFRKYQTYPQNLDDLETTRNIRFLRRRYKDPLTGKDFRLVHVGPGGMLTDSAIKQANPAQGPNGTSASGAQAGTGTGSSTSGSSTSAFANTFGQTPASPLPTPSQPGMPQIDPQTGQPINPGLNMAARRPSDRVIGGGQELPVDPNQQPYPQDPSQTQYPQQPGGQQQDPSQPQQYPGQPGYQPGQPGTYPGQVYPGQTGQPQYPGQPVYPGQPGQPQIPGQPAYPGQPGQPQIPGQPVYPGQPGQQQYPGQPPIPGQPGAIVPVYPGQPSYPSQPLPQDPSQPQPVYQQPAQYPGQPAQYPAQPTGVPQQPFTGQASAALPGLPGAPGTPNAGGAAAPNQAANLIQQLLTTPRQPPSSIGNTNAVTGGMTGIAGVGGTADGQGIHVINDHSKYKEWEFIYDIKNDKTALGAGAVMQNQLLQQQQQQNQQQQQQNQQSTSPGSTTTPASPNTTQPSTPSSTPSQ